jgi:hypothetical protein
MQVNIDKLLFEAIRSRNKIDCLEFSSRAKSSTLRTQVGNPVPKSIAKIEKHRELITSRIIKGTITRMRRFEMSDKIKPKKLKIVEFAILNEPEGDRLYRFGGFSDSE